MPSLNKNHAHNMDENKKNLLIQTGLTQWFILTMTFISFFINMSAISLCVTLSIFKAFKFL